MPDGAQSGAARLTITRDAADDIQDRWVRVLMIGVAVIRVRLERVDV